jgi:hypothetical protein
VILHVVTFRWKPGVGDADVAALCEDLERFRSKVGSLLDYRYGADLGLREGNGDFAVVALVASPEGLRDYLDHPAHLELLADRLGPMIETRLAVQIEVAERPGFAGGEPASR